jgi:hypothetical protein
MMSTSKHDDQQAARQHTFSTKEGREALLREWCALRDAGETFWPEQLPTSKLRAAALADWLRWCIAQKTLEPHQRLPPYSTLGSLFGLKKKEVSPVIHQLRDESLLPKRKTRTDKDQPQWTDRDFYLWNYIGTMWAVRFDQARRLLARKSKQEIENGLLSISRSSQIISRYTTEEVGYVVRMPGINGQPGWIYLTRRGLKAAGLPFRAGAPSPGKLEHLYWINEVRMELEDEHPDMEWISERALWAEQEVRKKGQKLKHIPDGILVLPGANDTKEYIDIEVQISRPTSREVEEIMGDFWRSGSENPLRYYVNRQSRGVVWSVYRRMQKEKRAMRPKIEIIDLEEWLHPFSRARK